MLFAIRPSLCRALRSAICNLSESRQCRPPAPLSPPTYRRGRLISIRQTRTTYAEQGRQNDPVEPFPFGGDEPSADLLPVDELADCAATALARHGKAILSYGTGAGYSPLRE